MAVLDCACHVNRYEPCSIPGGCGSAGCDHTPGRRSGTCTTCPVIRPDSDPRQPHTPPVCDGDRRLLNRWLGEISNLIADLSNPEPAITDNRRYQRYGTEYLKDNQRRTVSLGNAWADPVAALGGVSPINSRSNQPSVSGSRDRTIPINTTMVDLTADRRVHNLTGDSWPEDQVGHLSAATMLDAWCRDVRDRIVPDHHLPEPTVDQMVMWLRVRVDMICDRHPDVAEFADGLRVLRGALRSAAGVVDPQPERCDGVPCKRCDLLMLFKQTDGDVHCVSPDCLAVLREDEYREWVQTIAAQTRIDQQQHA